MQARKASERDFNDWGLLADIAGELMQVFFAGKLYLATSSKNPNPDDRPCGADRHLIEARTPGILGNSVSNFQESRLVFGTRGGKTLSLLTIFPSVRAF